MAANRRDGVVYNQPRTLEERMKVARDCLAKMKLGMTVLVDGMDDAAGRAYSAWPVRACLVAKDGRIAYIDGPGPRGFRPDLLAKALAGMFPPDAGESKEGATGDRAKGAPAGGPGAGR